MLLLFIVFALSIIIIGSESYFRSNPTLYTDRVYKTYIYVWGVVCFGAVAYLFYETSTLSAFILIGALYKLVEKICLMKGILLASGYKRLGIIENVFTGIVLLAFAYELWLQ